MMGELGERLRAAREAKGLSLGQVAEDTRIPPSYLLALESGDLTAFSSELHARGFLRNYALFLELDAEELAALYTHEVAAKRQGARSKSQRASDGPPPSKAGDGLPEAGGRWPTVLAADVLLGLVLVAFLVLVAWSTYQFRSRVQATPTAGLPPTPTVTPMPVFEGTAYTLAVNLSYAEHRLQVQERIDFTNATSETLADLLLNVYPNRVRNAFKLNELRLELDGERLAPEFSTLDVTLRVELPRPLEPNEHVACLLDFTLSLPQIPANAEFSDAVFGYSKRSVSLGNWYPVLAPYRKDRGWYGLTYFPVGDPYVTEVADYHVTITATQGVIVAGSGREVRNGDAWHYEVENARSFAFAASSVYEVLTVAAGDTTVYAYAFPDNRPAAEAALQAGSQALALFSELFGPYPYADYRIAETEFAGGMEFTGLTFLGATFLGEYDGTARTPLIPLTVHEVAHQWFYGLVGSDQVTEPWLDEALAEYSAYLFYEHYLPGDADWWWSYAVDQWAPTGVIDANLFEFRDNRAYVDAVYRRGAQFVRDLRQTMADPAFFAFLKEYVRRNSYRLARSRDFFRLVREFTTADLVPLQEEYFRQRILP